METKFIKIEGTKTVEEMVEALKKEGVPQSIISRIVIDILLRDYKKDNVSHETATRILYELMDLPDVDFEAVKMPIDMGGPRAQA